MSAQEARDATPLATELSTHACYSTNQEEFRHDSLGDVIDELSNENESIIGLTYYVGTATCHPASYYFGQWGVDSLVEQMQTQAYDEAGEWSEDFCHEVKDAKKAELHALIIDWLDKNVGVTFYTVSDVKECVITADDLARSATASETQTP